MGGANAMKQCKYATDTGRIWCNCPGVKCTEIECRNPVRLAAILPGAEGRHDGANWHTKYPEGVERKDAEYVLVRSIFCTANECYDWS